MSTEQEYLRHAEGDDTFEARMADRIFSIVKKHITTEVKDTLQENRNEIAEWTCSSSFKEMSAEAARDQRKYTLKRKGNQKQLEHELPVKAEIQGALDWRKMTSRRRSNASKKVCLSSISVLNTSSLQTGSPLAGRS